MYQYLARNWVVLEGPVIKGNFAVLVWTGDGATEPVELSRSTLRRYSEFERLDKMLKSGPLAPLLKGVQLPGKRLFGSLNPFGKSDDEFLSRRKVHLEAYLHILLSKPAVRNSDEFKGFLAVASDPSVPFIGRGKRSNTIIAGLQAVSGVFAKAKEGLPPIMRRRVRRLSIASETSTHSWTTNEDHSAMDLFRTYVSTQPWLQDMATTPFPSFADQLIQNLTKEHEKDQGKESLRSPICYHQLLLQRLKILGSVTVYLLWVWKL
eukprot:m.232898 g.232898  ORF g.232898 m.232898 type:complete len:264 (+) comp40082_c0_seq58:1364-2155(+)